MDCINTFLKTNSLNKRLWIGTLFLCLNSNANAAMEPQTTKTPMPTIESVEEKPIPQYTISIISPKSEETFQNSTQAFTVTVSVSPALEPEDTVAVEVDGSPAGAAVHGNDITIPPLERGDHTIIARVIQPKGKGAESAPVTFFQQRTSKLLPAHH